MGRLALPEDIETLVRSFGWSPERKVSIEGMREGIERQGFVVNSAAQEFLERFGGVSFKDPLGRTGVVDGVQAASMVEADERPHLDALLSTPLCPVFYLAGRIYFVSPDDRWVALDDNWDGMAIFRNAEGALRSALLRDGREGNARRLNDDEVPSGYRD